MFEIEVIIYVNSLYDADLDFAFALTAFVFALLLLYDFFEHRPPPRTDTVSSTYFHSLKTDVQALFIVNVESEEYYKSISSIRILQT